jgi:hypothetical protein
MVFVSKTVAVVGASLAFFDFPSKSDTLYQFSILKSTIDAIFLAVGSVSEYDIFANVSLVCSRRLEISSLAEGLFYPIKKDSAPWTWLCLIFRNLCRRREGKALRNSAKHSHKCIVSITSSSMLSEFFTF